MLVIILGSEGVSKIYFDYDRANQVYKMSSFFISLIPPFAHLPRNFLRDHGIGRSGGRKRPKRSPSLRHACRAVRRSQMLDRSFLLSQRPSSKRISSSRPSRHRQAAHKNTGLSGGQPSEAARRFRESRLGRAKCAAPFFRLIFYAGSWWCYVAVAPAFLPTLRRITSPW